MRKVIALCAGMFLLSGFTSAIVSCKTSKVSKVDSIPEDYSDQLKKINAEVKSLISDKLFGEEFISQNTSVFDGIYDKVSSTKPTYTLDKENDSSYIKIFEDSFNDALNQVNDEIKTKYSNYYQDSVPIQNLNQSEITLGYVDVNAIKKDGNIDNIQGLDQLKIVSVNFKASYEVHLKDLEVEEAVNKDMNIANNYEIYLILKNKLLDKIQQLTSTFLKENTEINISSDNNSFYKQLYNNFDIDYSSEYITLSRLFKLKFKNFIKSDESLSKLNFEFNENNSFLKKISSVFDDKTLKNCAFYGELNFYTGCASGNVKHMPHSWAGEGNQALLDKFNVEEFWKAYKEFVPLLDVKGSKLVLGKFKIDMSYINFHGLNLIGLAKVDKDKDFEVEVSISKADLETRVKSFLSVIIEFFRLYDTDFSSYAYTLKVDSTLFGQITNSENKTTAQILNILLQNFKDRRGKVLGDIIDIFSIKTNSTNYPEYESIDSNNIMYRYTHPNIWSMTFSFNKVIHFTTASYLGPYLKISSYGTKST